MNHNSSEQVADLYAKQTTEEFAASTETGADMTIPTQSNQQVLTRTCVCCQEEVDMTNLVRAPCPDGHEYCSECLTSLCTMATKDEAVMPPRCCQQPFSDEVIRRHLTPELFHLFQNKRIEYGTDNRIYCSRPDCSAFIPHTSMRHGQALCPECGAATCAQCKSAAHTSHCPDDPGKDRVLELAKEKGWQRCPTCDHMVELDDGCYHITCVCLAQFCYLCGSRWKTCGCAHFADQEQEDPEINMPRNVYRPVVQRRIRERGPEQFQPQEMARAAPGFFPPPPNNSSPTSVWFPRPDDVPRTAFHRHPFRFGSFEPPTEPMAPRPLQQQPPRPFHIRQARENTEPQIQNDMWQGGPPSGQGYQDRGFDSSQPAQGFGAPPPTLMNDQGNRRQRIPVIERVGDEDEYGSHLCTKWRNVQRPGHCARCWEHQTKFHYECQNCLLRVCRGCLTGDAIII